MNGDYIAESPESGNTGIESFSQSGLGNLELSDIQSLGAPDDASGTNTGLSSGVEEMLGNFSIDDGESIEVAGRTYRNLPSGNRTRDENWAQSGRLFT